MISLGVQTCGTLSESANREWLVTDGLGGYAMGTVAGLRTRRYHALLVSALANGAARRVALAALDPVLLIGDRRIRLATNEWADGSVDPRGYELLSNFELSDGVPRWTWTIGDTVLQREIAMSYGTATVAVIHTLLSASSSVGLELVPLCTWRDAHGERHAAAEPHIERTARGFVFEDSYRVEAPGWEAGGSWYRGARLRDEAARGLSDTEDLWAAGRFATALEAGESFCVVASIDLSSELPDAESIVVDSRRRARQLVQIGRAVDGVDEQLILAADQFIVGSPTSRAVVAGYPWFGAWSRDTMTSYAGLFLETGRAEEGRALLVDAASTLSEGMLANTADTGSLEYNTADATLWFLHALGRHVAWTGDFDLASGLADSLESIIDYHVAGTRYGIRLDPDDGLLVQGEPGFALTWMDARVDGLAVTPRAGKAVDINALWISGLKTVVELFSPLKRAASRPAALAAQATRSFAARFERPDGLGLYDVVDAPSGLTDLSIRPNQLLAASLPHGPGAPSSMIEVVRAHLLTPLGLRSLSPTDEAFRPSHRGDSRSRDAAYHQGTVWPWLIGAFVDSCAQGEVHERVLHALVSHLSEWGLGSVSETVEGAAPHAATGCPFQAWSVAETLRARRVLAR